MSEEFYLLSSSMYEQDATMQEVKQNLFQTDQ